MENKELTILVAPIIKSKIAGIFKGTKQSVPTLKTIKIPLRIELLEGDCPERINLSSIKLWPCSQIGIEQTFVPFEIKDLNIERKVKTEPLRMNFQYPGIWWLDVTVDEPLGYTVKTKQLQLTGVLGDGWPQNQAENKKEIKTNICRNPISAHDVNILRQLIWLKWGVIVSFIAIMISILEKLNIWKNLICLIHHH